MYLIPIFILIVFCFLLGTSISLLKKIRRLKDRKSEQSLSLYRKIFQNAVNGITIGIGFVLFAVFLYFGFPAYRDKGSSFILFFLIWGGMLTTIGLVHLFLLLSIRKESTK